MTIFILSSSSAGMPSVPGGCLIFSACAAAYQSSLRVGAPASPFPHSSCSRLASSYLCTIPSRVPTPQCSQKGVSHPCPSICIAWPCLRVVVSIFYCIRSLRGRNKPKLPLVRRISDMLQTTCPPTCPLVQVLVHFVGPKLDALDRQNSGQCKG